MECGNDVLELEGHGQSSPAPEPATLLLVLIGLIAIFGADVRRKMINL